MIDSNAETGVVKPESARPWVETIFALKKEKVLNGFRNQRVIELENQNKINVSFFSTCMM